MKAATASISVPIEPTTEKAISGMTRRAPSTPRAPMTMVMIAPGNSQASTAPCVAATSGPKTMVWTRRIA